MKTFISSYQLSIKATNVKCFLIGLFVVFALGNLQAQITFEQQYPSMLDAHIADFDGVTQGATAFADVNGDGAPDVLITGKNKAKQAIAKLYINNGYGNFELVENTPFTAVWYSSVAFADIDGDGDMDLLITGFFKTGQVSHYPGSLGIPVTKLYTNDGLGNFTEVLDAPFEAVAFSTVAFADVDGDGDQDVLIGGTGASKVSSTKLYINDGNGNFTLKSNTPFAGVRRGSAVFGDLDGDGDLDLLLSGQSLNATNITHIYFNDGNGDFTLAANTPFDAVWQGSNAIFDVDGDGDLDILITGRRINWNSATAKLYINDGNGVFTFQPGTVFKGVKQSSVAVADVDGDGDQDVVITGRQANNGPTTANLYINDGSGGFTLKENTLKKVEWGTVEFADVDGDGHPDLLLTGNRSGINALLYRNNGSGNFRRVYPNGLADSSIAFADIDGDGDQDVIVVGRSWWDHLRLWFYTNDGAGNFTKSGNQNFDLVEFSALAFADVDGDGDQDLLITGRFPTSLQSITRLYTNDGNGVFTQVMNTPFKGVRSGTVTFADLDGDGDQDVLITGLSSGGRVLEMYRNDGNGVFTLAFESDTYGVFLSSVAVADVDGDGDLDVMVSGWSATKIITRLFLNNGNGSFTKALNTPFIDVFNGSIAFADVDGDGDQDVLITGEYSPNQRITQLYINDGNGNFEEATGTSFPAVIQSSIAFADVDGDGDQDVLITGITSNNVAISKLYVNDGNGVFEELVDTPFPGAFNGDVAFADVNGNGKPDVLITGSTRRTPEWIPTPKTASLYLNTTSFPSNKPSGPSNTRLVSYPNPTERTSAVIFKLTETSHATLEIYDMSGRLVHSLFNATADAGVEYRFEFDGSYLPNGIYLYNLNTGSEVLVNKFMLAK